MAAAPLIFASDACTKHTQPDRSLFRPGTGLALDGGGRLSGAHIPRMRVRQVICVSVDEFRSQACATCGALTPPTTKVVRL